MIKVANCPCSLDDSLALPYGTFSDDRTLRRIAADALGVSPRDVGAVQVIRRSVDARKKQNVHYVFTLAVDLVDGRLERDLVACGKAQPWEPYRPLEIAPVAGPVSRPLVVGAGPAGLFAALYLARAGLRPLVVERGADVHRRTLAVRDFEGGGPLDPSTNIQFGEGGAGAFSDGKLTTGTKHPFAAHVLHWFVEAGAPRDILYDAKPHIGSDVLPGVVERLRNGIVESGGEVRFETTLVDVRFRGGRLCAAVLQDAAGRLEEVPADTLLLACGHSARDTFEMLRDRGLAMEQKPFSMGVRIEHLQADVDAAQYGRAAGHPALAPAEYKMAVHVGKGRSAYTFCMCPGGEVVCAASEEGGICTNGMSNRARDGRNANAALLVNVDPSDFGGHDPLAGVRLQREVERRAFQVARRAGGAPYQAPCQTVGDFLGKGDGGRPAGKGGTAAVRRVAPTYARGTVSCDLHDVLPGFVCETIAASLPLFDRKLHGFATPDAVMTAPETRSSSPVRIVRTRGFQAVLAGGGEGVRAADTARGCGGDGAGESAAAAGGSVNPAAGNAAADTARGCGIYPCGEGPGYAGGIMSAAADGMRVAQQVAEDLRERSFEASVARAVSVLREGKAAVFPTDTVAGLGVSAGHAASPGEIFRIKRRDEGKPVAWLVSGPEALDEYGEDVPAEVKAWARRFWPGPLTVIVKAGTRVPAAFAAKQGTIGLRMPDNATALRIIEEVGCPLATSSANVSGEAAPGTVEEVSPEVASAAAAVVCDDSRPSGLASTVVDCSAGTVRILREGAVTAEMLRERR